MDGIGSSGGKPHRRMRPQLCRGPSRHFHQLRNLVGIGALQTWPNYAAGSTQLRVTLNRHKRHYSAAAYPGADRAVYLVLDEFGQLGRAWREPRVVSQF
jgi:hypothetical protein